MAKRMLLSGVKIDTSPVPAYGTTRYSGAIDFKEERKEYFITSPRNAYVGSQLLCSSVDKRPKDASLKRTIEKRNSVLKNSAESSTVSICGNINVEEARCTCDEIEPNEELCNCLENGETDSETTCQLSTTNWKQLYKLTDTSDTKLVNSFENLFNCVPDNGDVNVFMDLYEPHPRKERERMKGKNLPPSGYDVTLILPQCVCLKSYQECKKMNEMKSDETVSDEKSDTTSV